MINTQQGTRLELESYSLEKPYLRLPESQLKSVQRLLDDHGIDYSVSEHSISLDNGPFIARIRFSRGADREQIQQVLDSVN